MESYNVRHSCGHIETITAKHGITRDTYDTQRFLASVPCERCAAVVNYTMPNLDRPGVTREYRDLQWAKRDALDYIKRGANQVIIRDHRKEVDIVIT